MDVRAGQNWGRNPPFIAKCHYEQPTSCWKNNENGGSGLNKKLMKQKASFRRYNIFRAGRAKISCWAIFGTLQNKNLARGLDKICSLHRPSPPKSSITQKIIVLVTCKLYKRQISKPVKIIYIGNLRDSWTARFTVCRLRIIGSKLVRNFPISTLTWSRPDIANCLGPGPVRFWIF